MNEICIGPNPCGWCGGEYGEHTEACTRPRSGETSDDSEPCDVPQVYEKHHVVDQFSCLETVRELWAACSDRSSWRSGLTDRIAKRLAWLASHRCDDWDQAAFESAMINYGHRRALFDVYGSELK